MTSVALREPSSPSFRTPSVAGAIEETLVSYFCNLDLSDVAEVTVQNAKLLVLDTIGATLSARGHESVAPVAQLVMSWGGRPEARALGSSQKILAQHAALINGTMARALELDDVHELAMLHSTATIVPVALAAAELAGGISGKRFLEAIIAGIDVAARLSLASLPRIAGSVPRTMSLTYQSGILAGSLTAARIMGMTEGEMRNVLGVAYSQCAGNQQALYEGVDTVRVQQGLSAMTAITSLQLGMAGVRGVSHALSGEAGYFAAFHKGHCDVDALIGSLGERFEVDNVSIKPFPCCKYTHTAIAAALEARSDPRFDLNRVQRVVAHVNSPECFKIVCEPQDFGALRRELESENGRVRAQFSLAHMVATALRFGAVEVHHLNSSERKDERTLALTERIRTVIDAEFDAENAAHKLPVPGILEVHLEGEAEPIRAVCAVPPGHPDNRMTFDQVLAKYSSVRMLSCEGSSGTSPAEMIGGLEALTNMSELIDALEMAD